MKEQVNICTRRDVCTMCLHGCSDLRAAAAHHTVYYGGACSLKFGIETATNVSNMRFMKDVCARMCVYVCVSEGGFGAVPALCSTSDLLSDAQLFRLEIGWCLFLHAHRLRRLLCLRKKQIILHAA